MRKFLLTPNNVGYSAEKEIRTTGLHPSPVGIKVNVAHRLPRSETTEDQLFPIAMNDVDECCVGLVEPGTWILGLEERTGWV